MLVIIFPTYCCLLPTVCPDMSLNQPSLLMFLITYHIFCPIYPLAINYSKCVSDMWSPCIWPLCDQFGKYNSLLNHGIKQDFAWIGLLCCALGIWHGRWGGFPYIFICISFVFISQFLSCTLPYLSLLHQGLLGGHNATEGSCYPPDFSYIFHSVLCIVSNHNRHYLRTFTDRVGLPHPIIYRDPTFPPNSMHLVARDMANC